MSEAGRRTSLTTNVGMILIIGRVDGRLLAVVPKVAALHTKNRFALSIIVGDLFTDPSTASSEDESGIDSLLNGEITIPMPTYFALGRLPLPRKVIEKLQSSGGELCENLYFLGRRTVLKTSEGIRIVALGGSLNAGSSNDFPKDSYSPHYSVEDANSLRGANKADILVTSEWPLNVRNHSKIDFASGESYETNAQSCVADLCSALKPRYHFSSSPETFFEREPFFHPPSDEPNGEHHITRFISLAQFQNSNKQKWIYAFSLDPSAPPSTTLPTGTTVSPFSVPQKRSRPPKEEFSRFSKNDSYNQRPYKRQRQPAPGPNECFFCLANPNLASHLVTSIGADAYLTIAKGPLSTPTTFPSLGCPAHILIIPLAHNATLASIDDPVIRENTYKEMQHYRASLNDMLRHHGQEQLGSVTWEVSRSQGVHIHWQFLPVPSKIIRQGLVEAAFKVEAENEKYPHFELRRGETSLEDTSDFFKIWIWIPSRPGTKLQNAGIDVEDTGLPIQDEETCLVMPLDDTFRFDLQFGRRVMAKLLGLESRMSWRDCGQSEQEEARDADLFKEGFKDYDFTLGE